MKKFSILATAAAAAIVAAAPASATVEIIQVNGGAAITVPPSAFFSPGTPTISTDTDLLYQFTLGAAQTLSSGSFTNTANGGAFTFSNLTLYSGLLSTGGSGAGLASMSAQSGGYIATPVVTLAAGNYTIDVRGTATGSSRVGSSLAFTAPAVPEAATWAMMLVGFGGVGGALRSSRRKVSFA